MKKLKKKYWVIIATSVVLLIVVGVIWNAMTQPTAFEDLDPEDYEDSPELQELVIILKQQVTYDDPWFLDENIFTVSSETSSDPRYFDLLIMCLSMDPSPKTPQFIDYIYKLCLFETGYEWQELMNGDYYKDESEEIRKSACRSLGHLGDKRAFPQLVKALGDNNRNVSHAAFKSLLDLKDKRTIDLFINMLEGRDAARRATACCALELIGDRKAVEPLAKIVDDEPYYVRRFASFALANFNDKRAVEPLIKVFQEPEEHPGNRSRACVLLGELGDKRAIIPLKELMLDSPHPDIMESAEEALKKLGVENPDKEKSE